MSYDLYRLYINLKKKKKKKMQTKAVTSIFVKNTFSLVDFFVLIEYVNCFCQCS